VASAQLNSISLDYLRISDRPYQRRKKFDL